MFVKLAVTCDRLNQVKQQYSINYGIRRKGEIRDLQSLTTIFIGDYCLFENDGEKGDNNTFIIGLILHFAKRFGEKLTWRRIEYAGNSLEVSPENNASGILCQWYGIDFDNCCLVYLRMRTHGYIEASYYRAHIPQPKFEITVKKDNFAGKKLIMTEDTSLQIKMWISALQEKQ